MDREKHDRHIYPTRKTINTCLIGNNALYLISRPHLENGFIETSKLDLSVYFPVISTIKNKNPFRMTLFYSHRTMGDVDDEQLFRT